MSYIVVYTLKHNDIADKFEDRWTPFLADDGQTIDDAKNFYKSIIDTDGGEKDWHLFTISLTHVLKSSDY